MSKQLKKGIIAVLLLILIVLLGASEYMLSYALRPSKNKGRNYPKEIVVMKERYPWIAGWMDSLQTNKAIRDTFVIAADGDRHHALLINAQQPTHKVAVIVPGYTDCAIDMMHIGYLYNHLMDMNILIPDLHANGKSDGDDMQMGWKDRIDVEQWINIADSLFGDSAGHSTIVVHGQSMGAATVMNVSGDSTSTDIKCFVEDCGYTSAWDEFSYEIREQFGLPDFPLMYTSSALCKLQNGWSFGEASPLKQVAKCHKPMLFIHGGNDDFVPTKMVYALYKAKPQPKRIIVFPGSAHARSYCDHRQQYEKAVIDFVSSNINN